MPQPERFEILIPWERKEWKVAGLAHGAIGAADGCGRAPMDWRLLPEYRLPAQQE
jgi:hypothetical protein